MRKYVVTGDEDADEVHVDDPPPFFRRELLEGNVGPEMARAMTRMSSRAS
jgi:hypothetical protein